MKNAIKHQLFRFGILPPLDLLRRMPEINQWIRKGCTGRAPPPVKRLVLSAYLHRYRSCYTGSILEQIKNLDNFVNEVFHVLKGGGHF